MVNVQVALGESNQWCSFGDVTVVDAARGLLSLLIRESDHLWIVNDSESWNIQARYEHAPEIVWKLTLKPRVVVDVIKSRGEE